MEKSPIIPTSPVASTTASAADSRGFLVAHERVLSGIAALLHDGFCQYLAAAIFQTSALREYARAGQPIPESDLHGLLETLEAALQDVRQLEHRLRAVSPEPQWLMSALARLADETSRRLECVFRCEEPVLIADPLVASLLFRAADEGICLALGRNGVSAIHLSLEGDENGIRLRVEDDAPGEFPIESLEFSRLHATALGAAWEFVSNPVGTNVLTCCISNSPPS